MSEEREPAFNPDAGEHVESAACRLLAMARERNAEVFCLFNDTRMTARPGMLLEEVLDGWSEGRRRTNDTTPDAVEARDPLDGLEQLRRIIDEQPEPAPESVMLGLDYCYAEWVAERARHAEEVARLEERCQSREEQLGKLSELYDVTQERLEDFEEREPDARLCAEWAATVALKATDVYSAARRYLCGESRGIVAQAQQENDSLRDQLRRAEGERDAERKHATEMEERALDLVRDLRLANVELASLRSLLPDVRACSEYLVEPVSCLPSGLRQSARNILAVLDSHECPECHMPGHHKMSCSRGGSKGGRFVVRLDSQGGEGE